ncbi:MAG: hypothetical protein ACYST5_16210, partial [Planctomycetota bacterium]
MHAKNVSRVEERTTLRKVGCQANISLPCRVKIVAVIAVLLNVASLSQAEEAKLGATFDLTYMSKWMT